MFSGSIVALLTPFKNGKVDEKAFQSFVDWQITQGTNGLVPVGTTELTWTMVCAAAVAMTGPAPVLRAP